MSGSILQPLSVLPPGRFSIGAAIGLGVWAVIGLVVRYYLLAETERRITLASRVTLLRGALAAVLPGFLLVEPRAGITAWVPAALFAAAGLLDAADGAIARARGTVSAFGERLDTEADGFLVLVGAIFVVAEGLAPTWFLVVGVARYAFIAARALRRSRGLAVGTDDARRLKALVYAGTLIGIWIALLPVTGPRETVPLLSVVGVVLVGSFLRSWLVVTGRLDTHGVTRTIRERIG